ncbi:MAG TPA: ABC transporter ATP-binding protein [Candidatus Sulfotelmatobacter sp.]|jgi:ABC-type multidrug transport system ATPase subunit|nr:ABC transporter ATP-binding protein [Candidatus Sulfotelmatobacter sp.]
MIVFDRVRFAYGAGPPEIVTQRLEIGSGLTLVLGPNGCGKSTLLRLAAGVERPDAGVITILGEDLWRDEAAARRPLAYVPEQPELTPYASLDEVLRLVARLRGESSGAAAAALESVGLARFGSRSIRELSMGQRRRAVLAAAWIGSPRVVLLDEPLEGMDRGMQERIVAWVHDLDASEVVVVVATHDLDPFTSRARRAIGFEGVEPRVFALPSAPEARRETLDNLAATVR